MGSAMIGRLLEAGVSVTAFNRTPDKLKSLVAAGATAAESLGELADLEVVFTTIASSDDLLAVTLGDGGLLTHDQAPSIIVDASTVSVEASALVRSKAEARGVELLAAPVSGNPGVAKAGRLTFAVSGSREAYEHVVPLLETIGAGATYVGAGELARLVKLCHNLFLAAVIQSLVEVTLLADKGGVSRAAFLEYLNNSVLGSTFTGYKTAALVDLDFHPTFTAKLLRKDVELGLAAARDLEVPMPVAALVGQIVSSLVGAGYGDEDFAALIALQAPAAGVNLQGGPGEHEGDPDGGAVRRS
jgi:3-hydroxyisobutyrate dehydrogenase-like beta-hydroxyacid dehydrogenase